MNTPETDNALIDNADLSDWGVGKSDFVYADFTRRLERERDQLRNEVAQQHAAYNAKVFECQQLRKVADELHNWPHREHRPSCSQTWQHTDRLCDCGWAEIEQSYNSLPHVKKGNEQ